MHLDLKAVAANIRRSETEDLLDRITIYRQEMEPEAVALIAEELLRRGIGPELVAEHGRSRDDEALLREDGTVERCELCIRPAVARIRGWHRLWGRVPLFPREFAYCEVHLPDEVPISRPG